VRSAQPGRRRPGCRKRSAITLRINPAQQEDAGRHQHRPAGVRHGLDRPRARRGFGSASVGAPRHRAGRAGGGRALSGRLAAASRARRAAVGSTGKSARHGDRLVLAGHPQGERCGRRPATRGKSRHVSQRRRRSPVRSRRGGLRSSPRRAQSERASSGSCRAAQRRPGRSAINVLVPTENCGAAPIGLAVVQLVVVRRRLVAQAPPPPRCCRRLAGPRSSPARRSRRPDDRPAPTIGVALIVVQPVVAAAGSTAASAGRQVAGHWPTLRPAWRQVAGRSRGGHPADRAAAPGQVGSGRISAVQRGAVAPASAAMLVSSGPAQRLHLCDQVVDVSAQPGRQARSTCWPGPTVRACGRQS
jgi:hypothetical protein